MERFGPKCAMPLADFGGLGAHQAVRGPSAPSLARREGEFCGERPSRGRGGGVGITHLGPKRSRGRRDGADGLIVDARRHIGAHETAE